MSLTLTAEPEGPLCPSNTYFSALKYRLHEGHGEFSSVSGFGQETFVVPVLAALLVHQKGPTMEQKTGARW